MHIAAKDVKAMALFEGCRRAHYHERKQTSERDWKHTRAGLSAWNSETRVRKPQAIVGPARDVSRDVVHM